MAEASIKLLVTEHDTWGSMSTDVTTGVCPVCHSNVQFSNKPAHILWHQDLANFLKVLAGT